MGGFQSATLPAAGFIPQSQHLVDTDPRLPAQNWRASRLLPVASLACGFAEGACVELGDCLIVRCAAGRDVEGGRHESGWPSG